MEKIIVRRMEQKDIPKVADIERECFSIPWSEKAFEDSLALTYGHFLVADIEGEIAGYVGMYQAADEGDITNIAVSPVYRRRGVAAELITYLIEEGIRNQLVCINLEVRESNSAAISLYEKYGFENLGIRKNFYEKPVENAVIMKKIL